LNGVYDTRVGYIGGTSTSPTYSTVCSGDGHSEAVRILYDPEQISYEKLLDHAFKMHNYQHEAKPQYQSAIFVHDDEQKEAVVSKIKQLRGAVATKVLPATKWTDAEEYHQHFLAKQKRKNESRFL